MAAKAKPANAAAQFGARVRAIRNEFGWSQETLAEKSGFHWTYVGSVERGERNVTLATIVRLAKALKTEAGDLVAGLKP